MKTINFEFDINDKVRIVKKPDIICEIQELCYGQRWPDDKEFVNFYYVKPIKLDEIPEQEKHLGYFNETELELLNCKVML